MDEIKKSNFQLSEKKFDYNKRTLKKHYELVDNVYSAIVDEIRQVTENTDEWHKIVFDSFTKKYQIARVSYINPTLMSRLFSHPNIISRIGIAKDNRVVTLSLRPFDFRWISEEEKRNMRFRALQYKSISEENLAYLEGIYRDDAYLPFNVHSIMSVYNYLLHEGADNNWIAGEVLKISGHTAQTAQIVQNVLDDFSDRKILCTYQYQNNKKKIPVVHMSFSYVYGYNVIDLRVIQALVEELFIVPSTQVA